MKHLTLPLILCLLTFSSYAAQIRSNGAGGGNWNNTGTWASGTIPGAGDQVVIEAGDSVYVTDTRTTGQLVMLMDAAGKSVFHVTTTGDVTFTSTSNNIIRVDPASFAGPYTSRLFVEGSMSVVNFAVSNDDQTTVDIDVDGTFSASGNVLWVYGGLGLNCSHTVDIGNNGTFSCGNFNMTSGNTNNDLTITNDGTLNVTLGGGSAFYANIAEDCDFELNVNDKMSVVGVLRTATADDNSTVTINVRDTLTITSALRMSTSGTALPTDNVLNMDFSNAYCSYAFPIFNGTGGSITSGAVNVSTIEQKGTGAATYVQVNENTTYHNLIISNTHPSGVYILEDTFTVDNLLGDLTVSTGATFKLQGSGGTPKPLGVGGNFVNNGTLTDNGSGITVKGDFTNTSVINNSGSIFDIDGNFTNSGTFNTLAASDKMDVEGNFSNSGTFDAEIDSLVVGGNFSNTANYTSTGGNNIYLSGDFANTGTYNFVDGDIISFEGTATQSITGTTTIDEMVVNNSNGVNITSGMTSIKTLLTLTSGQLNTNGNMTFISDVNETAALATVPGGASIIGDVTVQRFLNEGDGWYMLASPVTGATLADWNNELPMSGFTGSDEETNPWVSVYQYDETTRAPSNSIDSGYVEASNITNSLVPGEGWFVYYEDVKVGGTANTMDVTGPLQTGSVPSGSLSLTGTGPAGENGWHLLGNPYASPVDWSLVTKVNIASNEAYVMGADGNYRAVTADNVDYLYSSEAFWIEITPVFPLPFTGSVTFDEADKVNLTDDYNAKKAPSPYRLPLRMELTASGASGYTDYSVIQFTDGNGYTENFDMKDGEARKLDNALGIYPNIAMVASDSSNIYYNTISSSLESATIPLRVWQRFPTGTSRTFTVTFDGVKDWTLNNKCLTLWDSVTNITTKLDEINNTYTFTAVDTLTAPRLFLSYSSPLEVMQTNATCFGYSDGSATVEGDGPGNHTYTWLDAAGNVVHKDKLITGSSTVNTLSAGTYTVWVTGNGDCGTVATTIEIAEPDPIIADFSSDRDTVYTNNNASVQFTNSSANAVEYFWDFGDGTTSSQENPIHTYTSGGTFTVTMIASEELCADTLTSTVIVFDNVGVDELGDNNSNVNIYQQNGQTVVAFDLSESSNATITLHDMLGREVMNPIQLNDVKQRKVILPISSSISGIHTVGVYMNNKKLSKKLYYHSR
jgi:PKD repeat protein